MATASVTRSRANNAPRARADSPAGGFGFDWAMTALSALFLAGLWVDGWAHFHGRTDESFFTPWHFLFYGSFGVVALFLGYHQLRSASKGFSFARALPKGYLLSLVGVAVFAVSGFGDMIWHTLFGIEGGSEALTSPTHIGLGIGMGLIFTGPVRAAWLRLRDSNLTAARGWGQIGPVVVSMTLLLTLLLFFTSYSTPVVTPVAVERGFDAQDFGVTGIFLTSLLTSGILAVLMWNWRLPFGAFTLIFGFSTALLTMLNDVFLLVPGALIAGLIVDVLYVLLKPSACAPGRFIALSTLAPVAYFAAYFITIDAVDTIRWSVHVWTGAIFISGLMGSMMAVMMVSARHDAQP